ncbi:type IV secretion system protein [Sphingomonas sp. RB1R13]|uniref:type IV secretion system protein n=1 Tax=Sphingomonas sp. RB1R13 TaxID=3096159 RepID=UPI002FCCB52E
MAITCQGIPTPQSFAPGMIGFLDCQAQNLGANGYAALGAPGSSASILLITMLTIAIALIGYRIMLGGSLNIRDGVLTFVKIGIVLTLATSWPAYQTLIYDLILKAPAQLAGEIGTSTALPGANGGLVSRLDGVDRAMQTLAIDGVGTPPVADVGTVASIAPGPQPGFNDFALGYARLAFLVSTVGAFAIVRLLAGIFLAVGPLFAAFLLFDGTRGLFEGWLRALLGSALAAFAATIVLTVEIAFLEPWLSLLLARRASNLDILGAPAELLASALVFAIALFVVVGIAIRVVAALRVPAWQAFVQGNGREAGFVAAKSLALVRVEGQSSDNVRTRAASIASAVATVERREGQDARNRGGYHVTGLASIGPVPTVTGTSVTQAPRHATQRRTSRRISSAASSRDRLR